MSKFYCKTKDKDVDIEITYIPSTTNEDKVEKYERGTKVCYDALYGYCFEHDKCPLRKKVL
jgi:hypothetical protein